MGACGCARKDLRTVDSPCVLTFSFVIRSGSTQWAALKGRLTTSRDDLLFVASPMSGPVAVISGDGRARPLSGGAHLGICHLHRDARIPHDCLPRIGFVPVGLSSQPGFNIPRFSRGWPITQKARPRPRLDGIRNRRSALLSQRIRAARRASGLSQQALADRLGVTRGAVGNWESSNNVCPSAEKLAGIAGVFNVSFEWLATGRGAMVAPSCRTAPSSDSTTVVCPNELQILHAYRRAPDQIKRLIQDLASLRVVPVPRSRYTRNRGRVDA